MLFAAITLTTIQKLPMKLLTSIVLLILAMAITLLSTADNKIAPWRFISLADWHSAEKFVLGNRYDNFQDAVDENIATLQWIKHNFGGELILLPGDSNRGHWDTPGFISKFNPNLSPEQTILQAGKRCYEGMIDTFQKGGYDRLLMAVGDHEVGDNPWPAGSAVSRYQPEFREAFAKAFNYSSNLTSFKYTKKIGSANSRPLGTKYEDTSYAYHYKNVLFITVDVFHQQDYQTEIGTQGTVTGTVVGPQLMWLESVLSEARKNASIKHIFVQAHLPVLYPVRKVSSSGMLIDDGEDSNFWRLLRKYKVDVYFAGEVHANTVTKDPKSDLLQIVTRGNFFTNFQTVDISDEKFEMTLYRHFGERTSDGEYQVAGSLSVDKSGPVTAINATGELALLEPKSRLLHYAFEQDFSEHDRPINGLSKNKNNYVIDGTHCNKTLVNSGSFGPQYDALHNNVEIVPGINGNAGRFTEDSRMAVFAMGPLQAKHAIAFELSFKTQSKDNQILINTAPIWGNKPEGFLNLYLDDGIGTVAISDTKMFTIKSKKLNDGQWHRIKVSMPSNNSNLSHIITEVDGKKMDKTLIAGDAEIKFKGSMRFTVGGRGYSGKAMKKISAKNFVGLIDDVSLWSL